MKSKTDTMPDFSGLPITSIIKFAMLQYLQNIELCQTIDQLQKELVAELTKVEDLK